LTVFVLKLKIKRKNKWYFFYNLYFLFNYLFFF
jgi:hypothetical protein